MQKPCFHPYVFRIWISASNWRHMTYGLEGYTTDPRLILARSIAMASPSRRWRRRRRRQRRRTRTVPLGVFLYHTTLPAARDWAELPVDAILQVFRWLDHVDILMGAGLASRRCGAASTCGGSPASPTGSATGATPSAPWRARRCAAAPGGARSSGARSAATTRCSASSPTSEFTWINISLLPSISSQFLNF